MRVSKGVVFLDLEDGKRLVNLVLGKGRELSPEVYGRVREMAESGRSILTGREIGVEERVVEELDREGYLTYYSPEEEEREVMSYLEARLNTLKMTPKEEFFIWGRAGYLKKDRERVSLQGVRDGISREAGGEVSLWIGEDVIDEMAFLVQWAQALPIRWKSLWISTEGAIPIELSDYALDFSEVRFIEMAESLAEAGWYVDVKTGERGNLFSEGIEGTRKKGFALFCPFRYRRVFIGEDGRKDYCIERLVGARGGSQDFGGAVYPPHSPRKRGDEQTPWPCTCEMALVCRMGGGCVVAGAGGDNCQIREKIIAELIKGKEQGPGGASNTIQG